VISSGTREARLERQNLESSSSLRNWRAAGQRRMGNQSSTECEKQKVDGVRAKGVSLLTTAEDIEEWAEWLPDSLEKRKKTKDSDTSAAQRHVDWEDENIVTKETKVWFIFCVGACSPIVTGCAMPAFLAEVSPAQTCS